MTQKGYRLALRAMVIAAACSALACSSRHRLGRLERDDAAGTGGSRGATEGGTAAGAGTDGTNGGPHGTAGDGAAGDGAAGDGAAGGNAVRPGEFVAH